MGKGKAGDYPTTTMNTGLYGSSTTNKSGTTYNPTDFQKNLVGTAEKNAMTSLNEYLNPSYDSPLYQAQKAERQRQQAQAYDANVLSPLASRGLMRSSGLQAATKSFGNTLANQEAQALQDYQNQQANKLATLMGLYEVPYNMMNGTSGMSQSLSNSVGNYNLTNQQMQNQMNASMMGNLANAIGTIGGFAVGGPMGAAAGNWLGKKLGNSSSV